MRGRGEDTFNQPTDVAVSATTGEVFVADGYGNSRVVVFSKDGRYLREWGSSGTGCVKLPPPHAARTRHAHHIFQAVLLAILASPVRVTLC